MAQLGGELFATRGNVDNFFGEFLKITPEQEALMRDKNALVNARFDAIVHEMSIGEPMDVAEDSLACQAENESALQAARIQTRIAEHLMSAAEREKTQLRKWAIGYDDGLRTALAVLNREDK